MEIEMRRRKLSNTCYSRHIRIERSSYSSNWLDERNIGNLISLC